MKFAIFEETWEEKLPTDFQKVLFFLGKECQISSHFLD